MPYTRTWSEELVAEWLQLQGYFVEISVPIKTTESGGRFEADVLGVRIKDGVLEIMHVEVGNLNRKAENNIQYVQKKFSSVKQDAILNYCKKKLDFDGKVSYRNFFIATNVLNKTLHIAKKNNVNLKSIDDFIQEDVIPAINDWKKNPSHEPKIKGKTVTLPDGLWLLHLIEKASKITAARGNFLTFSL